MPYSIFLEERHLLITVTLMNSTVPELNSTRNISPQWWFHMDLFHWENKCVFHWNHLFSIIFSLWYLFSLTWKILRLAFESCQCPSCAHSSWVSGGGSCSDPWCCCHGSFSLHSQMLVTNQWCIEMSPYPLSLNLVSSICASALSEHQILLLCLTCLTAKKYFSSHPTTLSQYWRLFWLNVWVSVVSVVAW